jgi:hypothetical protein
MPIIPHGGHETVIPLRNKRNRSHKIHSSKPYFRAIIAAEGPGPDYSRAQNRKVRNVAPEIMAKAGK